MERERAQGQGEGKWCKERLRGSGRGQALLLKLNSLQSYNYDICRFLSTIGTDRNYIQSYKSVKRLSNGKRSITTL